MPKSQRQRAYKFGRVFFPSEPNPDPAIPNEILFQPLGNHVGNVIKLVDCWDKKDFPCPSSFERVKEAAKIHDAGKPQKFELQVKSNKNHVFQKYIYSFRGHRYLAESKDLWTQTLARGHHDFSVGDISRDTYELKKEPNYADIFSQNSLTYARELYILEMCDQIEAELACLVLEDKQQAESRTFMEYTITKDDLEPNVYRIEPWIFSPQVIELAFQAWKFCLSEEDKAKLKKCREENRDSALGKTLDSIAKTWWQSQPEEPEKAPERKAILKPYLSENHFQNKDCKFCYQQLAGFTPNPMQEEIFEKIDKNDDLAILLKAPTGSGKLEAIIFPALANNYRLILPLPARSLLEDQKQRAEKYLQQFSKLHPNREFSLVIDTGSQMYRYIYRNGELENKPRTINSKRHLYKGNIILTTLDKFLYRYFAFGDKQKSFVFPLRINKEKTLICFDESHSYDGISFTNFHSLVRALYEAGRSLILMTATMPPEHYERFEYLDLIDFIDDSKRAEALEQFGQQTLKQLYPNQKAFTWNSLVKRDKQSPQSFQDEFAQTILREWREKTDRRIIAVVETVKDAAAIYQNLKKQLGSNSDSEGRLLYLYHGRIADQIRPELYKHLQERDAKNKPYILVTTSAIEVGCDLNAEILISQICPPENLIQRAGRCNRKGNIPNAKVILVGDEIPKFINSLDESEWQQYQEALKSLKDFDFKVIAKCITRSQQVEDYRVIELFSMLHEYVYNADLTYQPLHKRGLIPTRSWKPSVNLVHLGQEHSISIAIDELYYGQQYADVYAYERWYDQEHSRWDGDRQLGWGSAYGKEITVRISPDGIDVNLPKYSYDEELGFVEIPKIFVKQWIDNAEEKLLYVNGEHKAVISYIKSLDE